MLDIKVEKNVPTLVVLIAVILAIALLPQYKDSFLPSLLHRTPIWMLVLALSRVPQSAPIRVPLLPPRRLAASQRFHCAFASV